MQGELTQIAPFQQTDLNVYDIRRQCDPGLELCYSQMDNVQKYLNQDSVKQAIDARPDITRQNCNTQVNSACNNGGDWIQPFHLEVAAVLNAGLPVLIYAGGPDLICNWLGNRSWTKNLVHFLRVYEAGHMVPYDQPQNSWYILDSWLSGDYALRSGSQSSFGEMEVGEPSGIESGVCKAHILGSEHSS